MKKRNFFFLTICILASQMLAADTDEEDNISSRTDRQRKDTYQRYQREQNKNKYYFQERNQSNTPQYQFEKKRSNPSYPPSYSPYYNDPSRPNFKPFETEVNKTPDYASDGREASKHVSEAVPYDEQNRRPVTDADRDLSKEVYLKINSNGKKYQNLSVTAHEGIVTLQGNLNSEAEREALILKIKMMPGVNDVDDQLKVSTQ